MFYWLMKHIVIGPWVKAIFRPWIVGRRNVPAQVAAILASAGAQAARHDDFAVLGQGFANGVQAFFHGIVDETAGVDDHQVRAFKRLGGLVALGRELREDEFGVGECLRASEGDEPDLGRLGGRRSRGRFVGM